MPDHTVHGFVRTPDGSIVTFDAGSGGATNPLSITSDSAVAGEYQDGNGRHGFIRTPDGSIALFDPPGALDTGVVGMNDAGEIIGAFSDSQRQYHAFIRKPNGNVITFAVTRTTHPTIPTAINNAGVITGAFIDRRNVWHGFLRSPHGKATLFDTGFDHVSSVGPYSINDQGTVAGDLVILPKRHPARSRGFIGFFQ